MLKIHRFRIGIVKGLLEHISKKISRGDVIKRKLRIGIELSGIKASDRGRGRYLVSGLSLMGFDASYVSEEDCVDVRIMLKRDFQRKKKRSECLIFDVSDAILIPPESSSIFMKAYHKTIANYKHGKFLSQCDAVVVASEIQKRTMIKYNSRVHVMPDVSFYHDFLDQRLKPDPADRIVFVWDGQGYNFKFLESVIRDNVHFFRNNDVLLKVITDKHDVFLGIDNEERLASYRINSKFVEWSEATFIQEVNSAHVGLAPVNMQCPHARAKPENKMINYLGLGLPSIASATEAYDDFSRQSPGGVIVCKSPADWRRALEYWRENRLQALVSGQRSREFVLKHYAPEVLAERWQRLICELTHAS